MTWNSMFTTSVMFHMDSLKDTVCMAFTYCMFSVWWLNRLCVCDYLNTHNPVSFFLDFYRRIKTTWRHYGCSLCILYVVKEISQR